MRSFLTYVLVTCVLAGCSTTVERFDEPASNSLVEDLTSNDGAVIVAEGFVLADGHEVSGSVHRFGEVVCPLYDACFTLDEIDRIQYSTRSRRLDVDDALMAPLVLPGAILVATVMASAGAGNGGYQNSDAIAEDEPNTVWLRRSGVRRPSEFYWEDGVGLTNGFYPCADETATVPALGFETDAEVAQWIWDNRQAVNGTCLNSAVALFDPESSSRFSEIWMLGAVRVRYEALHCHSTVLGPMGEFGGSSRLIGPFRARNGINGYLPRVKPNQLVATVQSIQQARFDRGASGATRIALDSERIVGRDAAAFVARLDQMLLDPATYAYSPPVAEICETAGGVAAPEIVNNRNHLMEFFHPFNRGPSLLLYGDAVVADRDVSEFFAPVQGNTQS